MNRRRLALVGIASTTLASGVSLGRGHLLAAALFLVATLCAVGVFVGRKTP